MKHQLRTWACMVVAVALASPLSGRAQGPEKNDKMTPVRLQVTLSRQQGEKKISSMPYTLSVNVPAASANSPGVTNLRMGAKIPIVITAMPPGPGGAPPPGSVQYQDIGTNIDARIVAVDDGRFRVEVTVEDSSVYPDESGKANDRPSFRSFRASNSLILKDGQTGQFTSATDKVNGEVTKVDVMLTIVR